MLNFRRCEVTTFSPSWMSVWYDTYLYLIYERVFSGEMRIIKHLTLFSPVRLTFQWSSSKHTPTHPTPPTPPLLLIVSLYISVKSFRRICDIKRLGKCHLLRLSKYLYHSCSKTTTFFFFFFFFFFRLGNRKKIV